MAVFARSALVWPYWGQKTLPEEVISSIASYYQRVTTYAAPMNLLVGGVMLLTVGAAQMVIFPGAQRLAVHADSLAV